MVRLICADAAAFRRLCVETDGLETVKRERYAAAFRRLCVETTNNTPNTAKTEAAAFRRLCVETLLFVILNIGQLQPPSGGCVLKPMRRTYRPSRGSGSRLQAAVC